jgi:hypothetical protein
MNTKYEIFFNNMKKEFGEINYHLYEIVKIYDSLITGIDNFNQDTTEKDNNKEEEDAYTQEEKEGKNFLKTKLFEFMEHYRSKMDETSDFKKKIDNIIQANCEHTFIYDTVDSGLDNSTSIEYCTKCYKFRE